MPLSSFPVTAASCGRAAQLQYRAYSSGGSYVGVPGAESPVVPAPGQFQEDSITCSSMTRTRSQHTNTFSSSESVIRLSSRFSELEML